MLLLKSMELNPSMNLISGNPCGSKINFVVVLGKDSPILGINVPTQMDEAKSPPALEASQVVLTNPLNCSGKVASSI